MANKKYLGVKAEGPDWLGGGKVTFPVEIIGIFTYDGYMYAVGKDAAIYRSRNPDTEKWERWHGES